MSLNRQDDRESKFRSVFGASYRTTDRSEARWTFFYGVMHDGCRKFELEDWKLRDVVPRGIEDERESFFEAR